MEPVILSLILGVTIGAIVWLTCAYRRNKSSITEIELCCERPTEERVNSESDDLDDVEEYIPPRLDINVYTITSV